MWNKIFEQLRLRMTFTYAVIFGVLILAIVFLQHIALFGGKYWLTKSRS